MSTSTVFSSVSPRLGLPLLFAAQAQKEVFVNEAHALIDALLHCAIEGVGATPPVDPADGTAWLVAAGAAGDWFGHDGAIACRQSGNWLFSVPCDGMRVFDRSTGQSRIFAGGWKIASAPALPAGGAVVDVQARTTIGELIASLRVAGLFPA